MATANILGFRAGAERQKRGPRIKVDNPAAQKVLEAHRDFPIWKAAGAAMDSVAGGNPNVARIEAQEEERAAALAQQGFTSEFQKGAPEHRIPFPKDETTLPARPAADTYNADYDSASLANAPAKKGPDYGGLEKIANVFKPNYGQPVEAAIPTEASVPNVVPSGMRGRIAQILGKPIIGQGEKDTSSVSPTQPPKVPTVPLTNAPDALKVTTPGMETRWIVPETGIMEAATPRATSTNNALGITDEAFSPGGSFSVASGPRGGKSQAEWDGLSQEDATAIRVAALEKQGQDLRDLRNVRSAADFKAGGPLTEGGRSVLEDISGGAPIEGYTRGTKDWRRENNTGAPTIVGTSFADDFAFADQAEGGGIGKLESALEDKNSKTRREAINALGSIYKQQAGAQPQMVGPDFGDQLAQAQMQQNALFKQAELAGKQQDRALTREQQALENRRAGTEADQAEVGVLTSQLDKVMGSGQVVPGTEGILNEVMLQKRASPLMVNGIIQEALVSLPNAREALANPDTDPNALKDKQNALAAIREYVAQKMPAQKMP